MLTDKFSEQFTNKLLASYCEKSTEQFLSSVSPSCMIGYFLLVKCPKALSACANTETSSKEVSEIQWKSDSWCKTWTQKNVEFLFHGTHTQHGVR